MINVLQAMILTDKEKMILTPTYSVTGAGLRGLNDRVPLGGSLGPADARRSCWENGYCESFNGKLRHELLNGEIFCSRNEAKGLIEQWRRHYNTVRPIHLWDIDHQRRRFICPHFPFWIERQLCSSLTRAVTKYPAGHRLTAALGSLQKRKKYQGT